MLIRNYSTSPRFLVQFVPIFWRLFLRTLFGTHVRAQVAMLRVNLRRALVWLPFLLEERRRGVKMPVTLQLVDDVACKAGCSNCVFTTFKQKGERLGLSDLERIFDQALEMNVTNVYLMGADPFYRDNARDFLAVLARRKYQLFFVFTEGKKLDDEYLEAIRRAGNIIPVLNIDGLQAASDQRKGDGTFELVEALLAKMKARRMPFFVTTMVSRANYAEVTGEAYVRWLDEKGAWVMAYVPYTPVDAQAEADLVMDPAMQEGLLDRSMALNRVARRLVVLDLLGIEQHLTSCPAGVYTMTIFHDGTVTPCPAVPFGRSDENVRDHTLAELFFDGHLYKSLRKNHEHGQKVHCMFYTDTRFLAGYVAEHRDRLRVLNPSSVRRIEDMATGGEA